MYRTIQTAIMMTSALFTSFSFANDGVFYASGNHLFPIMESDIAVKKEVLSLDWLDGDIKVTVEYIFHNPGDAKQLLVGFEAEGPEGDVDSTIMASGNPFITDFSVVMNGKKLAYGVGLQPYEEDKKDKRDKQFRPYNLEEFVALDEGFDKYIYYFTADFNHGTNSIIHEYIFKAGSSVEMPFDFGYILTAANRWAGGKIEDFTLNIRNMSNYGSFYIVKDFFTSMDNWQYDGKAEMFEDIVKFTLEPNTNLIFKQKNFTPKGELYIYDIYEFFNQINTAFDHHIHQLDDYRFTQSVDDQSYKILRNLPYAKRGYIFTTDYIQQYYEGLDWYEPNPDYKANVDTLKPKEHMWLDIIKAP